MANLIERLTMTIFARPHEVVLHCCFPECHAPVTDQLERMPLCTAHCLTVHRRVAKRLAPEEIQKWLASRGQFKMPAMPSPSARGYVYFIRLGNRVKIGYSRNPVERFKDLPVEEVLAIIPGSEVDERTNLLRFAHLRITGEWFKAAPELLKYAESLPSSSPK
jgi:hypothetical protein